MAKTNEQQQQMSEELNEIKIKINNLRADSNSHANTINEDRVKKMQEEMSDIGQRIGSNEKIVEKITS